jgi:DNA-binding CsgD family transcriptional regulator
MARLSAGRLHSVVEASAHLASFDDLPSFRLGALEVLRAVVPCDIASYNEIGPSMLMTQDPPGVLDLEMLPVFESLAMQNPLIAHYAATGDGRALRFSDLVGMRRLRRLEIHRVLYQPFGIQHQLAVALNRRGEGVIGIALNRMHSDFSDDDRAALDLLRPHLLASHTRLSEIAQLRHVVDAVDDAVLLVDAGRVVRATPAAERLLGLEAPAPLPFAFDGFDELIFDHLGRRLHAKRCGEAIQVAPAGDDALLAAAREHGLTAREAQIVEQLPTGAPTAVIARHLGISTRTAEKHLEHAYRKLEATGRAQALERLLG